MKREYCLFVYATAAARAAGEMDYTFDANDLDEAVEAANGELDEGKHTVKIFRRPGGAAPMEFVETHTRPQASAALAAAEA